MSEYQYYEFLAVDRPLDATALAAVRALSTRARITPTSFVNTYHWGDFKGKPRTLVERYYDAFLYTANWGTRQFMFRLPKRLLDPRTAERYCTTDAASTWTHGENVLIDLTYTCEDGGEWDDEDDLGEGTLASIIPARADLATGDRRLLYLAWLHSVTGELVDPDDVEPPVPAGLGDLPASLHALVDLLRIDRDLLAVAAQASPDLTTHAPTTAEWRARLAGLSARDKDDVLLRLLKGDPNVGLELRRQLTATPSAPGPREEPRTVAALTTAAQAHADERERLAAEERAAQLAATKKAAAEARSRHLDAVAAEGEAAWRRVDALIRATKPKEYDQAVALLIDLRDVAARQNRQADAEDRVRHLRAAYPNRSALLQRLDRAGLAPDRANAPRR
ncbi:MAG: hypothetical protein QG671_1132 [Actinomycetota bacterium]|nr:hypothetical protein [Actinomycetota bacterium]